MWSRRAGIQGLGHKIQGLAGFRQLANNHKPACTKAVRNRDKGLVRPRPPDLAMSARLLGASIPVTSTDVGTAFE